MTECESVCKGGWVRASGFCYVPGPRGWLSGCTGYDHEVSTVGSGPIDRQEEQQCCAWAWYRCAGKGAGPPERGHTCGLPLNGLPLAWQPLGAVLRWRPGQARSRFGDRGGLQAALHTGPGGPRSSSASPGEWGWGRLEARGEVKVFGTPRSSGCERWYSLSTARPVAVGRRRPLHLAAGGHGVRLASRMFRPRTGHRLAGVGRGSGPTARPDQTNPTQPKATQTNPTQPNQPNPTQPERNQTKPHQCVP